MKKLFIALVCLAFAVGYADNHGTDSNTMAHSMHDAETASLFVNISSSDVNKVAMAIGMAHSVMTKRDMPATLFFNVYGVHVLDATIPSAIYADGKSLHEKLEAFMADGGQVIICPMCMKNVGGMDEEDLLEGVVLGGADTTWAALFAENVTVLNY